MSTTSAKRDTFEISVFTKRGALALIAAYDKAGFEKVGIRQEKHVVWVEFKEKKNADNTEDEEPSPKRVPVKKHKPKPD